MLIPAVISKHTQEGKTRMRNEKEENQDYGSGLILKYIGNIKSKIILHRDIII
jgi:hypothetical protein